MDNRMSSVSIHNSQGGLCSRIKKSAMDIQKHMGIGKDKCITHEKNKGKFSCETCGGIIICDHCVTHGHNGHNLVTIEVGKKRKLEEFENYKTQMTEVLPELKKAQTTVRMRTKTCKEEFQKKKEEIKKHYEKMLREMQEAKALELQKLIETNTDIDSKKNEVINVKNRITKRQDRFKHNELCQFLRECPEISKLGPPEIPNIQTLQFVTN